jgi:radical SAM superfamily enzyme YgiQ (UPF0313 family)
LNRFKNLPDRPVTVLIRPPISRWKLYKWYSPFGSHEPTLGLLYIASYLQLNGYEVHILDGELLDRQELDGALKSIKPDIIGITTTTFSFFSAAFLASQLRYQLPDCLILLGGSHASALPVDSLIKISHLDGIIVGEGEETILEIVKKRDTEQIEGLVWKENPESQIITNKPREPVTNLDKYKLNWNLLNGFPKRYSPPFQSKRKSSASLVVSRGCFYDCSFCSGALLWGKKIRYHSPEYVVNLMAELKLSYSITDFYFHDDYFPAHPLWIKRFCNLLIEQKRYFSWSCASRVEVLNDEILNLMKKSGCRQIGIGVESASQSILDKVSKGISIPALRDGLNRISLANIDIKGFFILDAPGESILDLYKTLKLILASKFSDIQLNYYAPLPGSSDYYVYNPSDKLWDRMSLQHCLGYAKISPVLYPFIEVSFYIVSYLKIFIGRVLNKIFNFVHSHLLKLI